MSADERLHILAMVAQGTISADEAETLLAALDAAPPSDEAEIVVPPPKKKKRKRKADISPDMDRFRRYWEYPFLAGIIIFGLAGMCATSTSYGLIAFCGWSVVVVGALLALIGWGSQWSPWVHIRIREHDGTRIALSLPLPVKLFGGLLNVASTIIIRHVDRATADNIEMAASFLALLDDNPSDEPITVDVVDEDGDQVQIFIG